MVLWDESALALVGDAISRHASRQEGSSHRLSWNMRQ